MLTDLEKFRLDVSIDKPRSRNRIGFDPVSDWISDKKDQIRKIHISRGEGGFEIGAIFWTESGRRDLVFVQNLTQKDVQVRAEFLCGADALQILCRWVLCRFSCNSWCRRSASFFMPFFSFCATHRRHLACDPMKIALEDIYGLFERFMASNQLGNLTAFLNSWQHPVNALFGSYSAFYRSFDNLTDYQTKLFSMACCEPVGTASCRG